MLKDDMVKITEFVIGVAIVIFCSWIVGAFYKESWLVLPILFIVLIFILNKLGRRYIAKGILISMLIPIVIFALVFGACLIVAVGGR